MPKLEPPRQRDRLAAALAQLLAGWARVAPLLLMLEDLHWAGEDALDLLARLAPALGGHADARACPPCEPPAKVLPSEA